MIILPFKGLWCCSKDFIGSLDPHVSLSKNYFMCELIMTQFTATEKNGCWAHTMCIVQCVDKSWPLELWHDGSTYKVDDMNIDWIDDLVEAFISIEIDVNMDILFDPLDGPYHHEHNTTTYDSTMVTILWNVLNIRIGLALWL